MKRKNLLFTACAILGFSISMFAQPFIPTDLYLSFPLNGNATDVSGYNYISTINGGVTPAVDRFGNSSGAMQFDGSSGFIDIPYNSSVGTSDFSISYWACPDAMNSGYVFSKEESFVPTNQFRVGSSGDYFGCFSDSTLTFGGGLPYTPIADVWNFYTIIRQGSVINLYVNGTFQSTLITAEPINHSNTLNYRIGGIHNGNVFYSGKIDDLRMFKHALSDDEMNLLFNLNTPSYVPTVGLVAWMPFNGNTADQSINNTHATLTGATLTSDRLGVANSAYLFDGSSKIVLDNTSDIDFTQGATFAAWIKASVLINASIIDKMPFDNGSGNGGFRINSRANSDLWATSGTFDPGTGVALATAAYEPDVWVHVAGTAGTDDSLKIYVNGLLVDAIKQTIPMGANIDNIMIGAADESFYYEAFMGIIDEVGIWNRELTFVEIKALCESIFADIKPVAPTYEMSVYPNPANDMIKINTETDMVGSEFFIQNSLGTVVLSGKITDKITSVNINSLAKGVYILRIGNQLKHSVKLIKK